MTLRKYFSITMICLMTLLRRIKNLFVILSIEVLLMTIMLKLKIHKWLFLTGEVKLIKIWGGTNGHWGWKKWRCYWRKLYCKRSNSTVYKTFKKEKKLTLKNWKKIWVNLDKKKGWLKKTKKWEKKYFFTIELWFWSKKLYWYRFVVQFIKDTRRKINR